MIRMISRIFILSSFFFFFSLVSPFTPTPYFVRPSTSTVHPRSLSRPSIGTQFETQQEGSSDSTLSPYTESLASSTHLPISSPNYSTSPSYSPSSHQQNYTIKSSHHHQPSYYTPYRQYGENQASVQEPISPELLTSSNLEGQEKAYGSSLNVNTSSSPQLSPVFKSEAARQIIKEMTEKKVEGPRRRQIPREKRRHYTVSSSKPVLDLEDTFSKMVSFLSFFFSIFIFFWYFYSFLFFCYFSLGVSFFFFFSSSSQFISFSFFPLSIPFFQLCRVLWRCFFVFHCREREMCTIGCTKAFVYSFATLHREWEEPETTWTWNERSGRESMLRMSSDRRWATKSWSITRALSINFWERRIRSWFPRDTYLNRWDNLINFTFFSR